MNAARVWVLAAALAVLATARVTIVPGWTVPALGAVLAAEALGCAGAVVWLIARLRAEYVPATLVRARPACACPDHPGVALIPYPGGAARGMCPADGRSYQLYPREA